MKKPKVRERHYYLLNWESSGYETRFFIGTVFCFQGELWDLKNEQSWNVEEDYQDFVSLKDLGTKYRTEIRR